MATHIKLNIHQEDTNVSVPLTNLMRNISIMRYFFLNISLLSWIIRMYIVYIWILVGIDFNISLNHKWEAGIEGKQ